MRSIILSRYMEDLKGIEQFGGTHVRTADARSEMQVIQFKNSEGHTIVHLTQDLKRGAITINYITCEPHGDKDEEYQTATIKKILEYARSKAALRVLASVTTKRIPFWVQNGFVESKDNSNFYEHRV